jgi:SpoVK/Ycf46/Vps4 family AAA+-type ATPase
MSLISVVFLRLAEYYKGLLFLTTNRQHMFDEAFNNRIHVKIQFHPLSCEARLNIWKNLLTKKRDRIVLDKSWEGDEEIKFLARLDMNGRDIRNLIRTAYGYARSQQKELGVRHILTVMREFCSAKNVEEVAEALMPAAQRTRTMSLEVNGQPSKTSGPVEAQNLTAESPIEEIPENGAM